MLFTTFHHTRFAGHFISFFYCNKMKYLFYAHTRIRACVVDHTTSVVGNFATRRKTAYTFDLFDALYMSVLLTRDSPLLP
jgi:hypothetical protein